MNIYIEFKKTLNESKQLREEIEDDAPKFSDIKTWYAALQKKIAEDPAKGKKQLEAKITLLEEVAEKLKDEMQDPSGWRRAKYALKSLIPFNAIYRLFKMNDYMAGISFLSNSAFPIGGEMITRLFTYKAMIADMYSNTLKCIEYLKKKLKETK